MSTSKVITTIVTTIIILAVWAKTAFAVEATVTEKPDVTVKSNESSDVYNFYFQKAPGPITVIQGSGSPEPTAAKTGEAINQQAAAPVSQTPQPPSPTPEKEYFDWYVGIGRAYTFDAAGYGDGYGLFAQKNYNKYFGLVSHLELYSKNKSYFGEQDQRRGLNAFDVSVGAAVTPIHVEVFGSTVFELGGTGGFSTFMVRDRDDLNYDTRTSSKTLGPYIGFTLAINVSKQFSFVAETQKFLDYDGAKSLWSGRYKF